eukprot:11494547-Alexandrium_andersonii.AAC.1
MPRSIGRTSCRAATKTQGAAPAASGRAQQTQALARHSRPRLLRTFRCPETKPANGMQVACKCLAK